MGKYSFLLLVTSFLSLGTSSAKCTDSALVTFEDRLTKACQNRDVNLIESLYDFEGSPQVLIDERIYSLQQFFADTSSVKKIEFISLDRSNSDLELKGMADHLKPVNMNGTLYGPNLTVVGFAKVTFESATNTGVSTVTTTVNGQTTTKTYHSKGPRWFYFPLGILSDGSYRITMTRVLK